MFVKRGSGRLIMKKLKLLAPLAIAAILLTSCGSSDDSKSASASAECKAGALSTVTPEVLTIATGEPAYSPWVLNDKPESGEGFEAAVAYAIATELGYMNENVKWVRTTFDGAIAPGPKTFDFNIQQYSITAERAKVVDFSSSYYKSNQSIVSFKGSKIAGAKSIADVKAANPKIGAAVGTTSLDAVENVLGLKAQVFNDNAAGVAALKNGQIDGFVVDLPTAFYLSAAEIDNGIIVGQLENSSSADEGAGLLLSKDNPITSCVTNALEAIRKSGELEEITNKWLTSAAGAPFLK
jgi:polar amino acid transport system substrate-binding protein